ncbi:hypothetical protein [Methylovorus glucosotrophus]|uniref:Uncharacterized protein n=1 Tax=Methylovorus glucosotrophus (strain SIP3-4) TaxID=582744 RepID=C6XDT4_METGS|nr:hypothetical protein [Methylovorus glucosotrophus]ACT50709.1 hypothetical protein Msip34_1464 [Methylovorus glucosotrophus SIP3-4]
MDDLITQDLQSSSTERLKPSREEMIRRLEELAAMEEADSQPTPSVAGEAVKAVAGGVRDGITEVAHTIDEAATWLNTNLIDLRVGDRSTPPATGQALGFQGDALPEVPQNQTTAGKMGRSVFQFIPEFIGANKALAVTKLGTAVKGMAAGAAADFSGFDPHEARLSNLVLEFTDGNPIVGQEVFKYLAADPTDSNAEGRFKNAIEGMGLGLAAEGLIKGFKATRAYFKAKGDDSLLSRLQTREGLDAPATQEQSLSDQIDELQGFKKAEAEPPVAASTDEADMAADDALAAKMQAEYDAGVQPKEATPEVDVEGTPKAESEVTPEAQPKAEPQAEPTPAPKPKEYDPIAKKLAQPEYASIAPVIRKAAPKISQAKVTELMDAAQSGTLKDLADKVDPSDFNFDRMDSAEDVQNLIDATSKVFEKEINLAKGGTQSFEQIQELADTLGTSTKSLKELYGDTANLSGRVTANRALLAASAKRTAELASSAASGDSMALLAFRKQVMLHSTIQAQMKGVQTEVARALSAMRIQSKASGLVLNEVDDLLSSLGGREVNLEFAKKLASTTDPAKIAAMTRKGAMARTQDAVFEMWVNGVLSGPATHATNALGNTLVGLMSVAERGTTATVGKVFRGGAQDRVELGELQAQLFGMVSGLKDVFSITGEGIKALTQATGQALTGNLGTAKDILKTAEGEFGNAYKAFAYDTPIMDNALYGTKEFQLQTPAISAEGLGLDVNAWYASVADVLGTLVRTPGRVLTTTDEVFKAMHYQGELKAQAYRQARSEGLEGQAVIDRIGELVTNREAPLNGDPLSAMALDAARKGTFTNSLGDGGKAVQMAVSKIPGARYIFPFIRTPANIMNYVWERTPVLNRLNKQVMEDYKAGGVRRDTAVAKTAIGGAIYAMAAQLASEGVIVGGLEQNATAEKLAGQQAYSVKIGDTYYSFNKLDPLGMMMGLAADFTALSGNISQDKSNDTAAAMITALSNNLLSKSYLSSVSELFTAIESARRLGTSDPLARYLDRQAASFIPFSSAVRTARREDDPTVREVWDLMDTLKNSVPGFSKDLPPRRNVFGEPVVYGGGLGPDMASPIYTSVESDNPAAQEIARLNVDLQLPPRAIGGGNGRPSLDLTHEQYDRYLALAGNEAKVFEGKGFKDYLTDYVQTPEYLDLSDDAEEYEGSKTLIIKTLYAKAKQVGMLMMLEEFPGLKERYLKNIENGGRALGGQPILDLYGIEQ